MRGRLPTDRREPKLSRGPELLGLLVHCMLLVAILSALGYAVGLW